MPLILDVWRYILGLLPILWCITGANNVSLFRTENDRAGTQTWSLQHVLNMTDKDRWYECVICDFLAMCHNMSCLQCRCFIFFTFEGGVVYFRDHTTRFIWNDAPLTTHMKITILSVREITKSSSTFSATNISSNMIWFLQLHDTITMKSNHTGINYNQNNIAKRSHIMIFNSV